jgi:hypothetical protein
MYTQLIIVEGCNFKNSKNYKQFTQWPLYIFQSFHEKHHLESAPSYILITKIDQRCVQHGQKDQKNKDWFVELYFDMEIINY